MDEFHVVCSLVRMSLFGKKEDIPSFIDWVKVFINAGRNEVSGLCFEAAKRLPEESRPAQVLMECWSRHVQMAREDFRHKKAVAGDLRDRLDGKGIAMLLTGGFALADNYPDPELREDGKVKFVARTDFEGCNALVEDLGVRVNVKKTHASFLYDGVSFESFRMEPFSRQIRDTIWRNDGFLEPDPAAQAVLIVDNAAKCSGVFSRKVPLRLLIDLALLLRRYPSVPDEWESGLQQAGLLHFGETMLCACDILLGTGFRRDWGWMTRLRAGRLLAR